MSIQDNRHHELRMQAKRAKQYAFSNTYGRAPTLGKMRKNSPLNCGRSGCKICCNPRRLWGNSARTLDQVKSSYTLREELLELQ